MDAKDIRNIQEAYSQVYQVDEELTGSRKERASEILNKKLRDVETLRKLAARKRTQKIDYGSGNKAARRAGKPVKDSRVVPYDESYDYYDIILSHLLDEGYADTQEAAHKIMVNMSEDWRESIVEAEKSVEPDPFGRPGGKYGGVRKGGGYDRGYEAMKKKIKELEDKK